MDLGFSFCIVIEVTVIFVQILSLDKGLRTEVEKYHCTQEACNINFSWGGAGICEEITLASVLRLFLPGKSSLQLPGHLVPEGPQPPSAAVFTDIARERNTPTLPGISDRKLQSSPP